MFDFNLCVSMQIRSVITLINHSDFLLFDLVPFDMESIKVSPCIIGHLTAVHFIFLCQSQQLTSPVRGDHSDLFSGKLSPTLHLCV